MKLDDTGHVFFEISLESGTKVLYLDDVGSMTISYLRKSAEKHLKLSLRQVVISVPAEFGRTQRNITGIAAELAGANLDVRLQYEVLNLAYSLSSNMRIPRKTTTYE